MSISRLSPSHVAEGLLLFSVDLCLPTQHFLSSRLNVRFDFRVLEIAPALLPRVRHSTHDLLPLASYANVAVPREQHVRNLAQRLVGGIPAVVEIVRRDV